jgi:hypothetical protein
MYRRKYLEKCMHFVMSMIFPSGKYGKIKISNKIGNIQDEGAPVLELLPENDKSR